MTYQQIHSNQREWLRLVRSSLSERGYYYEREFCYETDDATPVVTVAGLLGRLYIPADANPTQPVIVTKPSQSAPDWRPFDKKEAIGWHNDFSTRPGRPVLSVSWIRQGDPNGPKGGAWRVASSVEVLSKLSETREGKRLVAGLSARAEPFGYRDGGDWRAFRVITGADLGSSRRGLRFYGRALEEGAWLRFGKIADRTCEIIARVEEAAEAVGEELPASKGSLLFVDNRLSLHDRMEQQVTGPAEQRRQAWLCFVRRLHQPL